MITRVLVANRGEIACRVFATCRTMGMSTVAVFSDPDSDAPHVRGADLAVRLPGSTSAQTYLRGDAIIAAARAAGADAIHPGYGFLSENAEFAQSVIDAGLVWIGPPPAAITAMGSKVNAKKLMADAGVPVLGDLDPAAVTEADLPLLIKASAGGGGRGMRIVRDLADLPDQLAAAAREAQSAFGDPTVFCEPYVERGHHIEVQVLADTHGGVWAVGERECSIQRRHQKVIEEAPAPLVERLGADLRERLFTAARHAVQAIGYTGAGTVEFLADETGRFYFLETNTRLQVEHPVTELTTGTDLVAWQLRVAMGDRLDPNPPSTRGHAIEVRLYAEDPAADWQPQSGMVHELHIDDDARFGELPGEGPGIRVDAGIESGSEISTFYDPMLAKVISWAPTRGGAASILARTLSQARIHGPVTNRDLLVNILRERRFLAGDTDTGYLDEIGLDVLSRPLADDRTCTAAAVAAALADVADNRASATVQRSLGSGWRNLVSGYQQKTFAGADDSEFTVRYRFTRGGVELPDVPGLEVVSTSSTSGRGGSTGGGGGSTSGWGGSTSGGGGSTGGRGGSTGGRGGPAIEVVLADDGVQRRFRVSRYGDEVYVDAAGASVHLRRLPRFVDPTAVTRPGSLLAPMPGSVIRVAVAEGDRVSAGQPLIWLEAMKMEHTVHAPADGVVTTLAVAPGRQLAVGDVLAVIGADSSEPDPAAQETHA